MIEELANKYFEEVITTYNNSEGLTDLPDSLSTDNLFEICSKLKIGNRTKCSLSASKLAKALSTKFSSMIYFGSFDNSIRMITHVWIEFNDKEAITFQTNAPKGRKPVISYYEIHVKQGTTIINKNMIEERTIEWKDGRKMTGNLREYYYQGYHDFLIDNKDALESVNYASLYLRFIKSLFSEMLGAKADYKDRGDKYRSQTDIVGKTDRALAYRVPQGNYTVIEYKNKKFTSNRGAGYDPKFVVDTLKAQGFR